MNVIRRLLGYLLYGIIFWLPVAILVLVGSLVFGDLENYGQDFLNLFLPEEWIHPGFGIVFWVFVFFLTGVLLKKTAVGRLFSRIPIIGMFFRMSGEVISIEMLGNMTPCLFLYSPTCSSYGWILSEEKVRVRGEKADFRLVHIYYPNVPTIITGQVFSVRKETVMKLGNPSREIIDILLYGLRKPEDIQYLPWEDEPEGAFQERASQFGLNQPLTRIRQ